MWSTVGNSIIKFASQFFKTCIFLEHINEALLVLIPKVDHPKSVRELRPISLGNVSYKIIIKVMTNHSKKFLSSII